MAITRSRPSKEILSGDSADVYFARADSILDREGLDPHRFDGGLRPRAGRAVRDRRGQEPARPTSSTTTDPGETTVEALDDGDPIEPKEVVLRIRARYRRFGLYETAFLGMLAQSTGWATAAREVVEAAAPQPVISFGARHVHPDITDVLDYAAIVGGCVGASTPAGARLAGLSPTGTMPHSLVLIFGDTVRAAEAFDRDLGPDVARIVLVDTFKDEAEEALRVAHALGDRLYGIRLDTPSERGRVTADLVKEVRARLDLEGFRNVKIVISGGLTPDRIGYFREHGAPVDSYAVGSYISGATPIDFTGDIKELDGRPDRQARPDPGPDSEPAPAAGRPGRLAGRRRLSLTPAERGPRGRAQVLSRRRGGGPPSTGRRSTSRRRSRAARRRPGRHRRASGPARAARPRRDRGDRSWAGRRSVAQVQVHQLGGETGRGPERA